MESTVLDPFGDYSTAGYLRNHFAEKDLRIVAHLEAAAFESQVHQTLRYLRRQPAISYQTILDVHRQFFSSVYPWAGEDRSINAPHIAIAKAGYATLFAHPADVQRAAEYALQLASDSAFLRTRPGHVFAQLAHAHPFLEGNGRTILTVFSELCRRAGFHIEWAAIDKQQFLRTLTEELLQPGTAMDTLVLHYAHSGHLQHQRAVRQLRVNFRRTEP